MSFLQCNLTDIKLKKIGYYSTVPCIYKQIYFKVEAILKMVAMLKVATFYILVLDLVTPKP